MVEIKKILKEGNVVIGTNVVLARLKRGELTKVFLTINCPPDIKEDITHYASLNNVEVVNLKQHNDELGVICKKPFSISVLGLLKGA